jgi:hypothetical protein
MSTAASEPPQAGRSFALPWRRGEPARAGRGTRRPIAYAPEALPERQPGLAALVPVGLGRFAATAATLVVLFVIVIAAGLFEPLMGRPLVVIAEPRFAATLDGLRQCTDLRQPGSLWSWLGQIGLVAAALGALVVRQLRWHRLDERRGRHAAWGCLAALFLVTSCAAAVPIGNLYGSVLSDLSGITIGPGGQGWWILTAVIAYTVVGLWALLPLYERAHTAAWLGLSFAAWAVAGGCSCVEDGIPHRAAIGQAAWIAGAACAAITMLAAARSVVREVRGMAGLPTAMTAARRGRTRHPEPAAAVRAHPVAACNRGHGAEADAAPLMAAVTDSIDGDSGEEGHETEGRPLSKAERKRLRKLARMSRAA